MYKIIFIFILFISFDVFALKRFNPYTVECNDFYSHMQFIRLERQNDPSIGRFIGEPTRPPPYGSYKHTNIYSKAFSYTYYRYVQPGNKKRTYTALALACRDSEVPPPRTCEQNPNQSHCPRTCEQNPNQSHCSDTCDEDPDQEKCDIDWSQVIINQKTMINAQDLIINNQVNFIDVMSLAKNNLINNQNLIIDSQLQIIDSQTAFVNAAAVTEVNLLANQQVLINAQTLKIQNQQKISDNQTEIITSLEQFNLKTSENQTFITEQVENLIFEEDPEKLVLLHKINGTLEEHEKAKQDLLKEEDPNSLDDYASSASDGLFDVASDIHKIESDAFFKSIKKHLKKSTEAGYPDSPINHKAKDNWLIGVSNFFPDARQCNISIPNPITGAKYELGHDWSVQLKEILAWIIAFYTFIALFEILFTPVKPKG